jgi:hypothetical protein
MKNIYSDRLESFSFDEMLEALAAVGTETQRLEFKREIASKKLGHRVCSLANASGGLIVIGIDDPVPGEDLRFPPVPTDVSDRKQVSYTSGVNAWVYPKPEFEIHPYIDANSNRTFLVVRVAASDLGPHEYLGGDESNLPIRRGTETKTLGLADINALQRRHSDTTISESPLPKMPFQKVYLQQSGIGGDFYFGVHIRPVTYGRRRVMDPDDDQVCLNIENRTRGQHEMVHAAMPQHESTPYGFWMSSGDAPGQNIQPNIPSTQLEILADGQVLMRFAQRDRDVFDQYINTFLTAYAVAQEMFYHFRLAPAANFHLVAHLNAQAKAEKAPQFHEDYITVDLARESFADAFTETVMVMLRGAGQARKRDDIHALLGQHEDKLPFVEAQLERWLSETDAR